jgi:hypothetical protein
LAGTHLLPISRRFWLVWWNFLTAAFRAPPDAVFAFWRQQFRRRLPWASPLDGVNQVLYGAAGEMSNVLFIKSSTLYSSTADREMTRIAP